MTQTQTRTNFDSMPNFRLLDPECIGKDGVRIQPKIYRSSRPDLLTEPEVVSFKQLGIRAIIDFRSSKEYRKASGRKILDSLFPVYKVNLPFYGRYKPQESISYTRLASGTVGLQTSGTYHGETKNGVSTGQLLPQGKHYLINFFKMKYILAVYNRAPWYLKLYSMLFLFVDVVLNTGYRHFIRLFARNVLNKTGLAGQYIDMIRYSQNQIYAALKLLSEPDNVPAMLNCAHGKDRTGIVSAFVLACFGKTKEYIAMDYARSETELLPMKDRLHSEIVERFHMCESFKSAKATTMIQVLSYVESEYGSLTNYLDAIGFSTLDQARLRQNLS